MRDRNNPRPKLSRGVRRGLQAIRACTTELAALALRGELRRVNQKCREKCQAKAHRANGQFEKGAEKRAVQVPKVDGREDAGV